MEEENKVAEKEGGGEINEENVEKNANLDTNSGVLAGLNLVLILSSLSLSDEEHLNMEEIEERESGNCNQKGKRCGSRSNYFPARKQEVSGFRGVERQMSKVQTKIRDCRHCRRL